MRRKIQMLVGKIRMLVGLFSTHCSSMLNQKWSIRRLKKSLKKSGIGSNQQLSIEVKKYLGIRDLTLPESEKPLVVSYHKYQVSHYIISKFIPQMFGQYCTFDAYHLSTFLNVTIFLFLSSLSCPLSLSLPILISLWINMPIFSLSQFALLSFQAAQIIFSLFLQAPNQLIPLGVGHEVSSLDQSNRFRNAYSAALEDYAMHPCTLLFLTCYMMSQQTTSLAEELHFLSSLPPSQRPPTTDT